MHSLILSRTNQHQCLGIHRVLQRIGFTSTLARDSFENHPYDLIIVDKFGLPYIKHPNGFIFNESIPLALDTLQVEPENKYISCDVAYCGEWGESSQRWIPQLSDINNKYTFKLFGSSRLANLQDYFWDFKPSQVAKNSKITIITKDSYPEHYWDSVFHDCVIVDTDTIEELKIHHILNNLDIYKKVTIKHKERLWVTDTYFHKTAYILNKALETTKDKKWLPILESLMVEYEQNRLHNRQSVSVSD